MYSRQSTSIIISQNYKVECRDICLKQSHDATAAIHIITRQDMRSFYTILLRKSIAKYMQKKSHAVNKP